jgi:hypothetical protein
MVLVLVPVRGIMAADPATESAAERIGGRTNEVVRIGNQVRRKSGPQTLTVHRLLSHLRARGFDAAPRAIGLDADGRELLEFIPGEAGAQPLPAWLETHDAIASFGALVRRYHDASASFEHRGDDQWFLPPREPREVVCHGDLSPENTIFRDGRAVALIDFDIAHPGSRAWDLGWAAHGFVPLTTPAAGADVAAWLSRQAQRLMALCTGYGLDAIDPLAVLEHAVERLGIVAADIERLAATGIPAFQESLAAGHPVQFRAHAAFMHEHARDLRNLAYGLPPAQLALARDYDADMLANYRYLLDTRGYDAERFLELVTLLGGVEATNRGLDLPDPPGGFFRLAALGELARSVEAWCLTPKYAPLFTDARRAVAGKRLAEAGFSP